MRGSVVDRVSLPATRDDSGPPKHREVLEQLNQDLLDPLIDRTFESIRGARRQVATAASSESALMIE